MVFISPWPTVAIVDVVQGSVGNDHKEEKKKEQQHYKLIMLTEQTFTFTNDLSITA